MTEPANRLKANRVFAGQTCGWTGEPIEFGEDIVVCNSCDSVHKASFWDRKGGCSLSTCENAPLKQMEPPPAPAAPGAPVPTRLPGGRPVPRRAGLPVDRVPCIHCGRHIKPHSAICRYCKQAQTPDGIYTGPKTNAPGAVASFVCGLIGVFFCGVILGIIAIVQANNAKRAIASDPRYTGEGLATAGFVLGIIALALHGLGYLVLIAGGI